MSQLDGLLDKYSADERFVSHRELHRIARLTRDEIKQLRAASENNFAACLKALEELALVKRERDEAREAARWLYSYTASGVQSNARDVWHWLEEE